MGFAPLPIAITSKGSRWLWAWAFAVPTAIDKQAGEKAQEFVAWATSREYVKLVASTRGWKSVSSGTRMSTYGEKPFQQAAPWAKIEFDAINSADPHNATLDP